MATKRNGRPPKIDAKLRLELIKATVATGSRTSAAALCQISYSTLARAFHADDAFAEALTDAIELFKTTHLARIAKASKGDKTNKPDWKASAWLLQHKFPEEYGRRNAETMTVVQVASLINTLVNKILDQTPKARAAHIYKATQEAFDTIHGTATPGTTAD